jgi:cell division protein FtsW (lipid II flippase)
MMQMPVRSRRWNLILAILGSVYTVSAVVLLAWLVIEVWNAARLSDRVFQIALVAAAGCSLWFVISAMENLGLRVPKPWYSHRVTR